MGRSAGGDRLIDVGRRLRAAFCFTGSLGRAAGDADSRDLRVDGDILALDETRQDRVHLPANLKIVLSHNHNDSEAREEIVLC
jgi:hypothetical protein